MVCLGETLIAKHNHLFQEWPLGFNDPSGRFLQFCI